MAQPPRLSRRTLQPCLVTLGLLIVPRIGVTQGSSSLPYREMAAHIMDALDPDSGEFAILRYDPGKLPRFYSQVRRALEERGLEVETMRYGVVTGFHLALEDATIYIVLPQSRSTLPRPEQDSALGRWMDAGTGRQLHFHWGNGTLATDGLRGEHSAAYDQVYVDALDIDYAALNQHQRMAIDLLGSAQVHVTTPAGTDLRFRVGNRPFNRQNGDASMRRMGTARTRIDRAIELPAGALRVAPIEESVAGTIVIPWARFHDTEVENLRLEFSAGRITEISASTGEAAVRSALELEPALNHFREFALGFNPKLTPPPGHDWVPYYGYGAGVVRLSLGNNMELGGAVGGQGVRWFFFPDATVTVGRTVLVERGKLVLSP